VYANGKEVSGNDKSVCLSGENFVYFIRACIPFMNRVYKEYMTFINNLKKNFGCDKVRDLAQERKSWRNS
jgi:hypothetical protein